MCGVFRASTSFKLTVILLFVFIDLWIVRALFWFCFVVFFLLCLDLNENIIVFSQFEMIFMRSIDKMTSQRRLSATTDFNWMRFTVQ